MKASDWIANYIAALGVSYVFTLSGGNSMHLNDSFGHHPNLTPVYMLHESGAALAAEACARASGKIGVCVVTAGPGVTNALTGCAAAYMEGTPVLFISGDSKADDLRRRDLYRLRQGGQQDVPALGLVRPITKLAVEQTCATDLHSTMYELVGEALSGRPGPVWLSIPLDVQAQEMDSAFLFPEPRKPTIKIEDIAHVAKLLAESKRPLFLLGKGCSGARDEVYKMAYFFGVPIMTTWAGLDLFEYDNVLFVGRPGPVGLRAANKVLQEADLLISIGARLDPVTTGYDLANFGQNATRVQVDIDGQVLNSNKPNVFAIRADAGEFVRLFQEVAYPSWRDGWIKHAQEVKAKYPLSEVGDSPTYKLVDILSEATPDDAVFANGVASYACNVFYAGLRNKGGQRIYGTHALGAMGCDVPNAIGACLGSGKKPTICLTGDGSFIQNAQELEVVGRLDLPIVFFVATNHGYGCIKKSQSRVFGRLSGADVYSGLTLPNPAALAVMMGIHHEYLSWDDDLETYILKAINFKRPVVVEYPVLDEPELPHIVTTFDSQGVPHSEALDQMWPEET